MGTALPAPQNGQRVRHVATDRTNILLDTLAPDQRGHPFANGSQRPDDGHEET